MTANDQTIDGVRAVLTRSLQLGTRGGALDRSTPLLGNLPELDSMAVVHVLAALEEHFGIARDEVETLVADARREADAQASLQGFTRQLHAELEREEKLRILEMLWQVALSDGNLEKHEDHLIRKVAGLLYVSHSDLIRVRNRVAQRT